MKSIQTEHCVLSPIIEVGFNELIPLFTDEKVRRYLGGPLPSEWAFNRLKESIQKSNDIRFTMRLKDSNVCIGLIFIAPHHNPADMEISYMFLPKY